jgi:hypothetical protein
MLRQGRRLGATPTHVLAGVLFAVTILPGCGLLFSEAPAPEPSPREAVLPDLPVPREVSTPEPEIPGGMGTLRQEDLAIRVVRGGLEIFLIPLAESITRTAAPDTWARLSALAGTHRLWFQDRTGADTPYALFLAVLYAEIQPTIFEPEELALVSGGLRHRLVGVRPLTPGWDQGRAIPGEPQMAVYAFPPDIALDREDLEAEYLEVRSRDWSRLFPRIQAEQARLRGETPP